ncbi:MAG: class I SAM-dependent methyltransferase [Anaerolineae bacterium]
MTVDYSTVTELAGDEISQEQLERLCHRYYWAGTYCSDKDVIEAACGTGPGLGYLAKRARSLRAGDFTPNILAITQAHYGDRIDLQQFDAQQMPFDDHSADVIILFEALYYLPQPERFVEECRRVLRSGGKVIIANANKDLFDFNPSPYSYIYHGVVELNQLFTASGFSVECFGYLSVREVSLRQRILRPVKKIVISLGLLPKSMAGKKLLKRFVFGDLIPMPDEIKDGMVAFSPPTRLPLNVPDREHKVIYCVASLPN